MDKRTLAVAATVAGVIVAVTGGSFVTVGADDAPRMEFGDGNVTVRDASGEEVTVVQVSENGTGSYVVERRAAEFEIRVYDGEEAEGDGGETVKVDDVHRVERINEDSVKVIGVSEMEAESLNETDGNGTFEIEVEDGGEDGGGTR